MHEPGTPADHDLDEVVATAFEAASGARPWRDACEAMCRGFDVWGVQVLGMFRNNGALAFSFEGGQMTPQASLDYVTRYHAISPRAGLMPHLESNPWVHDHEHFDESFVASDRFYQEFLIPHGTRWMSVTRLLDEGGVAVLLCLLRAVGTQPMDAADIARVERVRSGLVRALRVYVERSHGRPLAVAGLALLEWMPQGVLVVNEMRAIVYRNPAAERLLALGEGLVDREGYVDCLTAQGSRDLAAAIRSLGLGGAKLEGHGVDRTVVRLPVKGGGPGQLVLAIAVRPESTMGAFGDTPCAVLIVHPLDAASSLDPFVIGFAFNLTPAEAHVAAAVAEGRSPEQVARERGVSLTTVRAQLRSAFEKIGVSRQSELVRVLLEMPRLLQEQTRGKGGTGAIMRR
jgi:DNA-binding CsgD family transcriptional regulator